MVRLNGTAGIVLGLVALPVFAQTQLYSPEPGQVVSPSIAAIAVQRISINPDTLMGRSPTIELNLPDGPEVVAVMEGFDARPGGISWRGRFADDPDSHVGLTVHKGFVSGRISSFNGVWEIRPQPDGGHSIEKLADHLFPSCANEAAHETDLVPDQIVDQVADPIEGGDPDPCPNPSDPIDRIDLLVLYTENAMNAAGGQAQIEAIAQSAVDRMNESFINAQMPARVRLARTEMSSQNGSGDFSTDLNWLASDSGVAALRDQYGADMVSLLNNAGGFCGLGQLPRNWSSPNPNAVHQATQYTCAVGNLSFAHEHGHNMGFEHDPANGGSPGSGTYPYRYGHFVNGSYRTVMSYSNQCPNGCTRNPYFSNPNVSFMGAPTGIADQRENQRVGLQTTKCVTDYRMAFGEDIFSDSLEDLTP